MTTVAALRAQLGGAVRRRATMAGRPPRRAYTHYFIESEGLHSRIHLQNFYSTFWPELREAARAHITVFDAAGHGVGAASRSIPPFGSLFLEMSELLSELGSTAAEGMVAIDLEPPRAVAGRFSELPDGGRAEVKTPFWMAYYDRAENYMYVHSIDLLGGEVFGATALLRWWMAREVAAGDKWRSWRLIDADRLSELQIVCMNTSPQRRSTRAGVYAPDDSATLYEETIELGPRAVKRVRVATGLLAAWSAAHPAVPVVRIGLDPLLTPNGKPYVIMRYADGPASLHHG